jgi:apolipoprotein N-acyltransferase
LNRAIATLRAVRPWLWAPVAGLAAAFAHPPFGVLPGLLGYAVLFALIRSAPDRRSAFWRGWLFGTAYFAIGCGWVFEAFMVDAATYGWMAPFAVAGLAGGLALFWAAGALIFRVIARDGSLALLVFAGVFAATEWTRGHILTGFPWNLPGETWRAGGTMSQSASIFGAYGLSWVTLALAATPARVVAEPRRRSSWIAAGLALTVLVSMGVYGAMRLAAPAPDGSQIAVRIVQPNFPEQADYSQARFEAMLQTYVDLTAQPSALDRPPEIILWPEGALPRSLNELLAPASPARTAMLGALAPGQTLLIGAYIVRGDLESPQYFNSLAALRRTGDDLVVTAIYDKYRLVPFGEYAPPILDRLGVTRLVPVPGDFSTGPFPQAVDIGAAVIQPLICYESLFPGFTRRGEQISGRRADLIVNLSNDGWFGETSGPKQHFNLASYRAIEEGLSLVRSTPNGISGAVNFRGQVESATLLKMGDRGVADVLVNTVKFDTFYRRYGDATFSLMLLISLLALGFSWLGLRRRN